MNVIYQTDRNYPALTANTGCRAKRTKDGPREILRSRLVNAYLKRGYESEGLVKTKFTVLADQSKRRNETQFPQ